MTAAYGESADELSELVDAILRNDLASFTRLVFAEVTPGVELVWGGYLDLICATMAKVVSGETRNLIITIAPRHLKSICVSVALTAFFLGHNPTAEVLAVSYGQELAKTFAEYTRMVMVSAFYERIFATRLAPRQPVHALRTVQGGIRRATSIDGAATGIGADLMVFDDPQKPNEALSDAIRRSTNQAYENTFLSRRNDPATCRTVIVMQRLHEDDFVGHVLGLGGDWELLNLPAIAEEDEAYPYDTLLGPQVFRRAAGCALHPKRVPLAELDRIRARMGEARWAAQYMQRPAPAGGGLVKADWFKRYAAVDLPTAFSRVVQSWDTASTIAQWSDFSVCTTWGIKDGRIYLLNVFRERLLYPGLKRAVIEQMAIHGATEVLIEDHASGTALIQELRAAGHGKVRGRKPSGDKQMRMANQTAQIENGNVYIPAEAHWLAEYLHELTVFPNGKYDDQVDSTSQALDAIGNPQIKGGAYLEIARRSNEANGRARHKAPHKLEYQPGSIEWAAEQAALKAAKDAEGGLPMAA